MFLSVLMPVYNERKTIATIVQRVLDTPYQKELIIVDDGSTDGTRDYLATLQDSRVRVILNEKNLGKGGALREAFRHAKGSFCLIQDADLEYDPQDYPTLLELLIQDRADVVYGSRFLYRTRIFYFHHYLGNKLINLATNLLFNSTFTDLETGYKAFRREAVDGMMFRSRSFGFEVEFTTHILKKKYRIFEVPISYYGRTYGDGKKIGWKDGFIALYWIVYFRFFK